MVFFHFLPPKYRLKPDLQPDLPSQTIPPWLALHSEQSLAIRNKPMLKPKFAEIHVELFMYSVYILCWYALKTCVDKITSWTNICFVKVFSSSHQLSIC